MIRVFKDVSEYLKVPNDPLKEKPDWKILDE